MGIRRKTGKCFAQAKRIRDINTAPGQTGGSILFGTKKTTGSAGGYDYTSLSASHSKSSLLQLRTCGTFSARPNPW